MASVLNMAQGPDGVFRVVQPGTQLARVATPSAIAGATRTAGAAGGAGWASKIGGFLSKAVGWFAGLSGKGKLLVAGASLLGIHALSRSNAPDASALAGQYPVRF